MHVYSCQFMEYFCDKLCKCIILSCVVMNMHRQSSLWHPRNALAPPEHALNLYRAVIMTLGRYLINPWLVNVCRTPHDMPTEVSEKVDVFLSDFVNDRRCIFLGNMTSVSMVICRSSENQGWVVHIGTTISTVASSCLIFWRTRPIKLKGGNAYP